MSEKWKGRGIVSIGETHFCSRQSIKCFSDGGYTFFFFFFFFFEGHFGFSRKRQLVLLGVRRCVVSKHREFYIPRTFFLPGARYCYYLRIVLCETLGFSLRVRSESTSLPLTLDE